MTGNRLAFTIDLARRAAEMALGHFRSLDTLTIESKGHQDLVSNADREVETFIRAAIAEAFPDDGIVGEEHAPVTGASGHVWVIDPIDGTANFVRGIPAWCVVIACTLHGRIDIGVICEPCSGETFWAERGGGAFVNGKPIKVSAATSISDGSIGTGHSGRVKYEGIVTAIDRIFAGGGVFFRNASGALMLAYVASGRLIGYLEEHMNSWDCIAGLLMIEEAGGRIHPLDPQRVVQHGALVIAGGPGVYDEIEAIALSAFKLRS
jgi:myo-inositol-1(or 4)-monophosphatase